MVVPNFLYRFWLNGVGAAGLLVLAVLDALLAPPSFVPLMASSPLPSICYWPAAYRPMACCRWHWATRRGSLAAAHQRRGGREERAQSAVAWSAAVAVHRAPELEQRLRCAMRNWNARCTPAPSPRPKGQNGPEPENWTC
jgi:hypothetical protein